MLFPDHFCLVLFFFFLSVLGHMEWINHYPWFMMQSDPCKVPSLIMRTQLSLIYWFSFMNPSVFNWFPTVTTSLVPGTSHLHYLRALRACTRQPSHCALFWHLTSGGVMALHLAHTCACTHTHTHSGSLWDCFSLKNTIKIESSYFFFLLVYFF